MTDDGNGSGRRPSGVAGDARGAAGAGDARRARAAGDDRAADAASDAPGQGQRILHGVPRASEGDALAPVIPLFGSRSRASSAHPSLGRDIADVPADAAADAPGGQVARRPRLRPLRDLGGADDASGPNEAVAGPTTSRGGDDDDVAATEETRQRAEAVLLRKLRSRSLSLSEARGVVRGTEGADDFLADEIVDHFVDLGYLDDATFAEQLAMSAVEKRGEGRRAVAETLRKRGIPRDVAEAALAALPDDDAERALDFARSKVRAVEGVEYEAALRRLAGQLGRRGYPSSVALTAARSALAEAGIGRSRPSTRPASGVRFTPDE
ncbi:regulatory protein RecX [Microbacterium sp. lyk4-40-TSB-66]|uniref:regulatory protein RecX n=1 Tax=Microbacterium sp. lyk4-40-TSB-66 TaxID=3040294 RepID=UPI0025510EC6|nr:regulatory protein RecX [Microbacterium sp. lyk4-40-TSB-66]